jgi:hypothetical protein
MISGLKKHYSYLSRSTDSLTDSFTIVIIYPNHLKSKTVRDPPFGGPVLLGGHVGAPEGCPHVEMGFTGILESTI